MAFTHLGNRGHANAKTNATGASSEISISPDQTIPAGSFIVVWAAHDSFHPVGGEEGDPLPFTRRCDDTVGNVYVTVAGGTDGQSGIYSQVVIFVSQVQVAITTSDVIQVTSLVASSGIVDARAISVHEFSVDSDKFWAVADRTAQVVTNRATDPGSITWANGKSSTEYLILHGLSAEGPETDAYTWDSDYTQITGDGTTGGAADTNIHLRGGFRIASIASDTVDVTSTTADRDYTQCLQALTEIGSRRALSFPRNATILDDFNRADENPVDGGLWDTSNCSPRSNAGATRHLRITSNQLRDSSGSPGLGGSWYDGTTFTDVFICDGFDVFMTMAVAGQATLTMRGSGCTETTTADGISVEYVTTGFAELIGPSLWFGSLGNAGKTDQNRGRAWLSMTNGWKMGIGMVRVDDGTLGVDDENYIYWWINRGSGWEVVFAVHGYGASAAFNGFDNSTRVKVGVGIDATATRIDDVGGGPTEGWCLSGFIPQFYRRAFG